jgi:hypothetical protein
MTDIFSSATTENTEVTTTENTATQTKESFVDKLVGEGKKFKDIESLAKGKLEADNHINEITKTLNELREELSKQEYSKQLLEQLNKDKGSETLAEQSSPVTQSPSNTGNTTQSASDNIEALVEKVITEKERSRTVTQNISIVTEEMEKQFGDKASSILNSKSKSLNISVDRLKEIASESPTAFFQLIGVNSTNRTNNMSTITQSSIRSENFTSNSQERDFDYYQKLRKENRSLYYSPKIQNMLIKDRERLGNQFYKS